MAGRKKTRVAMNGIAWTARIMIVQTARKIGGQIVRMRAVRMMRAGVSETLLTTLLALVLHSTAVIFFLRFPSLLFSPNKNYPKFFFLGGGRDASKLQALDD